MIVKLHLLFRSPKYFRYSFLILLIFSVLLSSIVLGGDNNLYTFDILFLIFLGIRFYEYSTWHLLLFTGMIITCRYLLIPDSSSSLFFFIIHFLTYFLITLISAKLVMPFQRVNANSLKANIALNKVLNSVDAYTLNHSKNVAKYAVELARKMNLSEEHCDVIQLGALLHDIGKNSIPESILNKPGKLNEAEYDLIKTHPTNGYEIIKHIQSLNKDGVLEIIFYHHERYDGQGYPEGLKGDQIPLEARIVAIADTYDAMTSRRVYRKGFDAEYTLNEIRKNKGTQFDPEIVDVFLSLFEKK